MPALIQKQIQEKIVKPLEEIKDFLKEKKEIALVLGSGGARGLAHIGVINILKKNNIPIDLVIGTSIGALVGGLYCAGCIEEFIEKEKEITPRKLGRIFITRPTREGLTSGKKIDILLKNFLDNKKIEDLVIPLIIIATDLNTGKEVVITKGSLVEAIHASIAIPGLIAPVHHDHQLLVDGGIIDPIPINLARKLAKKAIIVDVIPELKEMRKRQNTNLILFDIIADTINIMEHKILKILPRKKEVLIKPDILDIGNLQYHRMKEAIKAGEKAALKALPKIKEILE